MLGVQAGIYIPLQKSAHVITSQPSTSATTPITLLVNNKIVTSIRMTLRAALNSGTLTRRTITSTLVLGIGDRLKMARVNTRSVPAKMVQLHTLGYCTYQ